MVLFFPCYHIQKCRSSKKVGRKDIILRFFFSLGILFGKKKTAWEIDCFFFYFLSHISVIYLIPGLALRPNQILKNSLRFFFFQTPKPEGKKNRKIGFQKGRQEIICDNMEKIKPWGFAFILLLIELIQRVRVMELYHSCVSPRQIQYRIFSSTSIAKFDAFFYIRIC